MRLLFTANLAIADKLTKGTVHAPHLLILARGWHSITYLAQDIPLPSLPSLPHQQQQQPD